MPPKLRFYDIYISPKVNEKINSKHGVTSEDVEDASAHLEGSKWVVGEDGSEKLLTIGTDASGRRLRLVLYPTAVEGYWNLGSVFPI